MAERSLGADGDRSPRAVAPARRGELFSGVCALALIVALVAFAWFGADGVPPQALAQPRQYALGAFSALGPVAALALTSAVLALSSLVLHTLGGSQGARSFSAWLVALVGGASAAALTYRVLIALPQPQRVVEAKLGAIIGLLAAIGLWLGAIETLRGRHAPSRTGARGAR